MSIALQTITAYIEQWIHLIAAYYFSTTLVNQSPQWAFQAADILLALEASDYYLIAFLAYINCFVLGKWSENIKDVLTAKTAIILDALLAMGYCIFAIDTRIITRLIKLMFLCASDASSPIMTCSTTYGKVATSNTSLIIAQAIVD